MDKNFINIDLDDPKTSLVAEALSNKTCVKIISLLAEQELTASDISSKLKIPLNTTGYNLDKLITCGLIEKSSNFFWSVKGKKTPVYKVANKKIIISPKKHFKGILPAILATGVFAMVIRYLTASPNAQVNNKMLDSSMEAFSMASEASSISSGGISLFSIGWIWFVAGALFSLLIAFLWDWLSYRGVLK